MYALAEKLGKFAHEVMAMPASELVGWLAYFHHQQQINKSHV